VNGYFGGALYARYGGRVWIRQMLISASLLPALVCGTAFFINFIAIYYHASRAIPFGSMVRIAILPPEIRRSQMAGERAIGYRSMLPSLSFAPRSDALRKGTCLLYENRLAHYPTEFFKLHSTILIQLIQPNLS